MVCRRSWGVAHPNCIHTETRSWLRQISSQELAPAGIAGRRQLDHSERACKRLRSQRARVTVSWTRLSTCKLRLDAAVHAGFVRRSVFTWELEPGQFTAEMQRWRHIRIQQNGKNASGQTSYLSLSGFEIYGLVTGVCDDVGM